jgi:hypothetical protein
MFKGFAPLLLFIFKSVTIETLEETACRDDQALNVPDAASARQMSLSISILCFKGIFL